MTRKNRTLNLKASTRMYVLAGGSSVVLVALTALLVTRTVQADARLRLTPTPPALSPTPPTLTPSVRPADKLQGIASWYGGVFDGRKTASGERFDMYAMTACHPTLPFGTMVRVENLENHHSVMVRITDRGDLIGEGRIIDLSYGAAQKLKMVKSGLVPVELTVLSLGKAKSEQ